MDFEDLQDILDVFKQVVQIPVDLRYLFLGFNTVEERHDPQGRFCALSIYDADMNQIINVKGKDCRNTSFISVNSNDEHADAIADAEHIYEKIALNAGEKIVSVAVASDNNYPCKI